MSKKHKKANRNRSKRPSSETEPDPSATLASTDAKGIEVSDPGPKSKEDLIKESPIFNDAKIISDCANGVNDDESLLPKSSASLLSPLASEFVPKIRFPEGEELAPLEEVDPQPQAGVDEVPPTASVPTANENGTTTTTAAMPTVNGALPDPILEAAPITPEEDPEPILPYLSTKHPLESRWTLWYLNPWESKGSNWENCLKKVYTVSTIEDFWSLWWHIAPPSELRTGCDYSFFKEGIKPMWEDNKGGGRWLFTLERKNRCSIDNMWLEVVLMLISGVERGINGSVINIRTKANKFALWMKGQEFDEIRSAGHAFKDALQLRETITFESHESTMKKTGSTAKSQLKM